MNELENNVSFFRFEDLRIYAKAMEYVSWLHSKMSVDFQKNGEGESFSRNAFLNAANAIALYTAEGSSRNKSQFLYYMKMAKSSVRECVVFTEIAYRLQAISEHDYDYSRNQLMELTKMIGSLISSIQRSIGNLSSTEKDDVDMDTLH